MNKPEDVKQYHYVVIYDTDIQRFYVAESEPYFDGGIVWNLTTREWEGGEDDEPQYDQQQSMLQAILREGNKTLAASLSEDNKKGSN
jgi:hypothetical protein